MQQVRIDAERRLAALVPGDRDLVRLGKLQQPGAAGQIPLSPWRNHRYVRLQCIVAEFEAHLVVALAGGPVRHRVGAHQFGNLDLPLGDQRTGDRRAEQILALIKGVGAEHREDEVAHERLAEVVDEDLADAEQLCLAAGRFQLLALAEIGGECHHLAPVGDLQPAQDHAGVEPARVGEHDLLDVLCPHRRPRILTGLALRSARSGPRQETTIPRRGSVRKRFWTRLDVNA